MAVEEAVETAAMALMAKMPSYQEPGVGMEEQVVMLATVAQVVTVAWEETVETVETVETEQMVAMLGKGLPDRRAFRLRSR